MIILKGISVLLIVMIALVLCYIISGFIIPLIPINSSKKSDTNRSIKVFVTSDGIHTDFVLPVLNDIFDWKMILNIGTYETAVSDMKFIGLGWGDKGFYLDIPTWNDLTFKVAFNALCRPSPTVMHVSCFKQVPLDSKYFRTVELNLIQYKKLCNYILGYFHADTKGNPCLIPEAGYGKDDNFYIANHSYHAIKTCNEWVNKGLKTIGVKTAIWSPGAFGIFIHERSSNKKKGIKSILSK